MGAGQIALAAAKKINATYQKNTDKSIADDKAMNSYRQAFANRVANGTAANAPVTPIAPAISVEGK